MTLLRITARVASNFHSPDGIRPKAERELVAQAATAVPFDSVLAPDWGGFIRLLNGGLAINSDNSHARMRANRLGFVIEEEGRREKKTPPRKAPRPTPAPEAQAPLKPVVALSPRRTLARTSPANMEQLEVRSYG